MNEKIDRFEESADPYNYGSQKVEELDVHGEFSHRSIDEEALENKGTKRGLSARHIQMISLGGCIG